MSNWFETWFDSSFYHTLYGNRNEDEARVFIGNLLSKINLKTGSSCWDLCCGKGRHAKILNENGMKVIGTDLSPASINDARQFENSNLKFFVHDMRQPLYSNYFDAVFNLFTSFGYFDRMEENRKVYWNVAVGLKRGGIFIQDYLNRDYVLGNLVEKEEKECDSKLFTITRRVEGNLLIKTIQVTSGDSEHFFEERVQLFSLGDFSKFAEFVNLKLENTFGNYSLDSYNSKESPRLIMCFKK